MVRSSGPPEAVSISKGRLGTTACACAPVSPRRSLNRRRADAGRELARHPSPALRERAPRKTLTRASESRVTNPNPKGGGRGALMTITSAGLAKLRLLMQIFELLFTDLQDQ